MTGARWQQVKTILADALARESDADRLAFVAVSCGEDVLLREEVDALLAQNDAMWCDDAFQVGLRATLLSAFAPAPKLVTEE